MPRAFLIGLLVLVGFSSAFARAPVLLISIDGLHPDYVIKADQYGLKIPHLRKFVTHGTYSTGVIGVVPTVTYPSHTTIVTGVAPVKHGIHSNTPFDPLNTNKEGWYWYAEDLRAPTLWKAAKQAKLVTASVNWPVTIGDPHIDYLLPEFWRASTIDDIKLMRALSRPEGLMEKLEAKVGRPFVDGYIDTTRSDQLRTRFSVELLRTHRPTFMATHLIALDGIEHQEGPYVPLVFEALEAIDVMIGELVDAALANDPASVIAVVSDHGFIATHTAVHLRSAFVDAGLITLKQPAAPFTAPVIASWEAQLWPGGACAAVVLKDPKNADVQKRVANLLAQLKAVPGNGIAAVLSKGEIAATKGFPTADFLIEFEPGFYFGNLLRGEVVTPATSRGTHGYLPHRPEMHAAFFVMGKGIASGRNLNVIDMRQIGPALADILGVKLPPSELPSLSIGKP